MHKIIIGAVALFVSGCSLAPRHTRPELPTPSAYPVESGDTLVDGRGDALQQGRAGAVPGDAVAAPELAWGDFFVDARLRELIAASLVHNRDMAIAVARINEARGLYRVQGSGRLPNIGAQGEAFQSGGAPGTDPVDQFGVSVAVSSFELDFWGRVRNLSEAARYRYLATAEAKRAFELSLIGQVASSYLVSRELDEQIRLATATVESRRAGLRIVERRRTAGISAAIDQHQAEALLTQAEASLAALKLSDARNRNLMAVLVGTSLPESLPQPLSLISQLGMPAIAEGLPSELLTARPDIVAAEAELRAMRADVGAARAAFFPAISLTGLFGFASNALEDLVSDDNRVWRFGGTAALPIFAGGRLRGNLAVARAREEMAVASYERAVQGAFREVADALAGRRYLTEQVSAQERNTAAQRRISELAAIRYREGVVGYLQVLDAERSLFSAEQALLQFRRLEAENLVRLYLVLGGGTIGVR